MEEDYVKLLREFVEEYFINCKVVFFITKKGTQRVEVRTTDTGETIETLECVEKIENNKDYNEIAQALLFRFIQELEEDEENL